MEAAGHGQDDPLEADIQFHIAILQAVKNPFFRQFEELVRTAPGSQLPQAPICDRRACPSSPVLLRRRTSPGAAPPAGRKAKAGPSLVQARSIPVRPLPLPRSNVVTKCAFAFSWSILAQIFGSVDYAAPGTTSGTGRKVPTC
jgi:hypothetical protein